MLVMGGLWLTVNLSNTQQQDHHCPPDSNEWTTCPRDTLSSSTSIHLSRSLSFIHQFKCISVFFYFCSGSSEAFWEVHYDRLPLRKGGYRTVSGFIVLERHWFSPGLKSNSLTNGYPGLYSIKVIGVGSRGCSRLALSKALSISAS